ncbi:hypothetical protein SUDANB70_01700 [Streptomyces sp. enrichment culture]
MRALIQVGGVPVATAREVLGHVDDDSLGRTVRLGAALWALPQDPGPDEDDPSVVSARAEVDRLLSSLGWETAREPAALSPVHRSLVAAVAALHRLGHSFDAELMRPYGELMHQVARRQLDHMETLASRTEQVELAVASAMLFEPVLRALHRLAQEEESARRYGIE